MARDFLYLTCIGFFFLVLGSEYELTVTTDSPVAQGSQVTFNLTLLRYNKPAPKAQYQLEYRFEGLMVSFNA